MPVRFPEKIVPRPRGGQKYARFGLRFLAFFLLLTSATFSLRLRAYRDDHALFIYLPSQTCNRPRRSVLFLGFVPFSLRVRVQKCANPLRVLHYVHTTVYITLPQDRYPYVSLYPPGNSTRRTACRCIFKRAPPRSEVRLAASRRTSLNFADASATTRRRARTK